MEKLEQQIRAALNHAAVTGYAHITQELRGEIVNVHQIIEVKPNGWKWALVEAAIYAGIFLAMGYFARPVIERML